jgi:hypothetical protein
VAPRYQVVDRPPECSSFGPEDACCSSSGSGDEAGPRPGRSSQGALSTRLALERLYLAPLEWGRGVPLVTVDAATGAACLASGPGAARAHVLAAQAPQQQQQNRSPPDQRERSPDYYANVGDAIRTLREDIPLLFERELNCEWRWDAGARAYVAVGGPPHARPERARAPAAPGRTRGCGAARAGAQGPCVSR